MKYAILLLLTLFQLAQVKAQLSAASDSLKFWGDAMISMRTAEFRESARNKFQELAPALIGHASDSNLLDFHPSIVKSSSGDGKLRIYSWASEVDQKQMKYFMFIFFDKQKPVLLTSHERNYKRINFESFDQQNWYGALYYHILEDTFANNYILLGFASSPDGTKHRIIEAFSIQGTSLKFGERFFVRKDEKEQDEFFHRIVLHYSPSAQIFIKYERDLKQLTFDHIASYTDPKSGETLLVPDGSFEAFHWQGNLWIHKPYLKTETMDSAPIEKPVFDKESKSRDILGRKKSKQ
ncbi:MAG: hypothetical protein IPM34_08770 [Saprospiraceae bacterium]|nr:hypothetical protein [Saprospiraceae bacterium]